MTSPARSPRHASGRGRSQSQVAHRPSLTRRVESGFARIFLDAAAARSGTLVIGLVLAAVMGPQEFGSFGVVVLALLAAQSISQLGVGHALNGWRPATAEVVPEAATVSLASSAVVYVAFYLAAPRLAASMGTPAASHVIRLVTVTVLINGLCTVPRAMLQRRAPWLHAMAQQMDNWIGVAVTIGLALAGHGLMGFAVGRIAGSVASAALCIALSPAGMRLGVRPAAARGLLRVALPFAASGLLAFAISNVDQIIVGRMLHARDLGYYLLALCLATWPVTVLSKPVRDAAPTAFTRFRSGPQLAGSAFVSSANLLAAVTLPVCVVLCTAAAPLVRLVYGPAWAPAAHVLPWLAVLATLRIFYALANDYFSAITSSRRSLAFHLVWLCALAPALAAGALEFGIVGVAVVQVAISVLILVPWYLFRLTHVAARPRVTGGGPAVSILAAAGVWLAVLGADRLDKSNRADLAIAICVALVATRLLVWRLRPVYVAVRQAGAGAVRNGGATDILGPSYAVFVEPVVYGVAAPAQLRLVRPDPEPAARDLESRVRVGTKWSMLNSVVLRLASFLVGAVLARTVFGPAAWGLYAISQVVLAVLLSVNELGISAAIVRWEGDVRSYARTVATLSLIASTLMYAALYATAPTLARTLGSPSATHMLRVLCFCVIIDALCAAPLALLNREFAQGRRMLVDTLNFAVGTLVTIWLAYTGYGVMSFAWGALAGCVVAFIVCAMAAPYAVVPGWNTAHARQLLRFGLPLAGANLFGLGVLNVDSAIVGATLGAFMLGLYQLAFNISSWPVTTLSLTVQRVSFAGFSRMADAGEAFAQAFNRALSVLMALTVPACVLLATLAGPLIHAVYGARWLPAAGALSLLSVLGLMRAAFVLINNCIAAADKRSALMTIQGLWLAVLIPVLLVGARLGGITGVSAGHVLVAAALVGPASLWILSRAGIPVPSVARACLRPAVGGALMAIASLFVIHLIGGSLTGLAAAAAAGVAVYLPVIYPMRALLQQPSGRLGPEGQGAPAESRVITQGSAR